MKNMARKFLKRMIENGGYIANGLYEKLPRYWHSNTKVSSRLMDITLFHYMLREQLIYQDRSGRYLITPKGERLARPWWEKIFK